MVCSSTVETESPYFGPHTVKDAPTAMTAALTKGQNAPLTDNEVFVSVVATAPVDLSALLVAEDGKVRSDADFVFFNQSDGPGVRLQGRAAGQTSALHCSLAAVPADIDRIRTVITLDDNNASFGQHAAPTARLADGVGNILYEYRIEGLDSETIVIAVELYRRQGGWKVRAVGQGYAGGFAALVTDHGVSVDDEPAKQQPTAPATAPSPPPSTYPGPSREISLVKGRSISLVKGQKVSLRKNDGVALTQVKMGLGWDPITRKGMLGNRSSNIDLDASAILIAQRDITEIVYYGNLRSKNRAVVHEGDNLTGEGDGDDEVINVDLTRIPLNVTTIVFLVTSYKGQTFEQIKNAFCRLIDVTNGELARYTLQGGMPFTGMVMAKVFRSGTDWKLEAIGEGIHAKTPSQATKQLHRFIGE